MMRSIAAMLCPLALEACVHEQVLEPAAGASLAPDRQDVAETAAAGVTVKVARDSLKRGPGVPGQSFHAGASHHPEPQPEAARQGKRPRSMLRHCWPLTTSAARKGCQALA